MKRGLMFYMLVSLFCLSGVTLLSAPKPSRRKKPVDVVQIAQEDDVIAPMNVSTKSAPDYSETEESCSELSNPTYKKTVVAAPKKVVVIKAVEQPIIVHSVQKVQADPAPSAANEMINSGAQWVIWAKDKTCEGAVAFWQWASVYLGQAWEKAVQLKDCVMGKLCCSGSACEASCQK